MNENEVKALMESVTSAADWDAKCDQVKTACGGYPEFWYPLIVLSGLASRVAAKFGSTSEIEIYSM